jgi:hypothetical protein
MTNLNYSIIGDRNTSFSAASGREEAAAPYLVNNTKLPTGSFVIERYLLSEIAAEILPKSRCRFCCKSIVPGKNGVAVIYSKAHSRASYGNLMTCGSIWLCAVCAAKISERRRVELVKAAGEHKGGLALITFTLQHDKNARLADTLGLLSLAAGKIFEGDWWTRFKQSVGYVGCVKANEITWSPRSGWHPHKHDLFFFEGVVDNKDAARIQKVLTDRYLYILEKFGGSALPGLAVDVRTARKNADVVAAYIAKFDKLPKSPYWGVESELTKSYVKRSKGAAGMTFWQLLKFAGSGDSEAVELVKEYDQAVKGKSSLAYSRGLKTLLKIDLKTDQEISDQLEKDGVEIAFLVRQLWRQVVSKKLRAQLLDAAGSGSVENINRFLVENDIVLKKEAQYEE